MAIRKEEEKKNGMKITDNMDGEKKANEKLQAKYEPGVFSLSKYNKYKKALGIKVMPSITIKEALELLRKNR